MPQGWSIYDQSGREIAWTDDWLLVDAWMRLYRARRYYYRAA